MIPNQKKSRFIGSYFLDPTFGWVRMKTLDRECSEQRDLQVWKNNPGCRGSRFGMYTERRMKYLATTDRKQGLPPNPMFFNHTIYKETYNSYGEINYI